jgi:hypothetical protein
MILGMEFPLVGVLLQPAFWILVLLGIILLVITRSK